MLLKAWVPLQGSLRPRARQERHTPRMRTPTQEAREGCMLWQVPITSLPRNIIRLSLRNLFDRNESVSYP